MTAQEIRRAFLEYFRKQGHTIVPSSPLVPQNDPTLLFTNAGMVQFKEVFLGTDKRPYLRAASCQKCVRAGGKHNDLENVGHTARHHTFFEMLGNFSFGDYFKQEAVRFGWEFLTECLKLPKEKLWVTVFTEDDEAEKLWRQIGVPAERIVRLGEKDNFWSMGEVGPCGPCSEIIYDQGPDFSCGKSDCKVGCDCDRYLELWNLVFMQYNRDSQGRLTPLPAPSIDTGMGLERVTAVVQQAASNYESDLFLPLVKAIADLAGLVPGSEQGVDYQVDRKQDVSLHVVADHARALTFLINDQVMPSNEGRGYVLRRIIRRAVRHGRLLGIDKPFLYKMVGVVVDKMQDTYTELREHREYIASLILAEEERFSHTLEQGLKILQELTGGARGEKVIPGKEIFKLYDTYGFPPDLSREILEEQGLSFAPSEFETAMRQQQEQARSSSLFSAAFSPAFTGVYSKILNKKGSTDFIGYTQHKVENKLLAIIKDEQEVEQAGRGEKIAIILPQTPFYPEKGGQVADTGWIIGDTGTFKVEDVQELSPGIIVHQGVVESGNFKKGQGVTARIDAARRRQIACNHTATHILQAVLRQVLGDHVKQAGSLVAPERLRFDFTHFSALTPRELKRVEELVNEHIRTNYAVTTQEMELEEAMSSGAVALFDEKYDQQVRVVSVGEISKELCGGTHLTASGEIGLFKLVSESSVAAGIRRIEAVSGEGAYQYISRESGQLTDMAALLRCAPAEIVMRVEKLLENSRRQEKELRRLKDKLAVSRVDEYLNAVREVKGVKVLALQVPEAADIERLRSLGDLLKQRLSSGVIVLGAEIKQKVALITIVTPDLIPPLHAGGIIKQVAQITGGGGGGRADMAQAGGKDVKRLKQALNEAYAIVEGMLLRAER